MPVYEFRCTDCGEGFEIDCHMHERDEKAVCLTCGSRNVKSILTASFSFPRHRRSPGPPGCQGGDDSASCGPCLEAWQQGSGAPACDRGCCEGGP